MATPKVKTCGHSGRRPLMSPSLWLIGLLIVYPLTSWGATDKRRPAGAAPAGQSTPASRPRQIIVISDLHMGEGKDAKGNWYPQEDFRWPDQFVKFLKHIDREGKGADGKGATDLIINGDLFDFLESRSCDCQGNRGRDFGCTEEESLIRLRKVLQAHQGEMRALGEFAKSGNNHLIILAGNHDAALLFPKVRAAALAAIGGGDRVSFIEKGYWLSDDKLIYLEHGHQIGHEANKFKNWPSPFLEKDGQLFLERPWGERFMQDYYNKFEVRYRIIDNLWQRSEGLLSILKNNVVRYVWEAERTPERAKDVAEFLKFSLFKVSWRQFIQGLGEEGSPPEWNLDAIKEQGPQFLAESFSADHPLNAAIRNPQDPNHKEAQQIVAQLFQKLTDEDLKTICDQRALLAADKNIQPPVSRCAEKPKGLGAGIEYITSSAKKVYGKHLIEVVYPAVKAPFQIFIFGHTHLAEYSLESPVSEGSWRPLVFNSGAWQRTANFKEIEALRAQKNLLKEEMLDQLSPEELPARYSFVRIKPYKGKEDLNAELLYWMGEEGKKGMTRDKPSL